MKVLTNNKYYGQIADVIREQNGTSNTYTPLQMVRALKDLFYEEVEGVPPITFQGIGENLLDYRIDGASGGVGDLITDSLDEKLGKYKVPVIVNGKNLFNENSAWNLTGSFARDTLQFPASKEGNKRVYFFNVRPNTFYTVSMETVGDRLGITEYSREINPVNATTDNKITPDRIIYYTNSSFANPYTFQTSSTAKIVGIFYSYNTLPIHLQIEIGNIATDYEPYHEPTTTNIYLDEPIEAKANIPSEYTEVEYIRNTGPQYIDAGIIPSSNWKYEIIYKDNAAQGSNYVMGSRQTTSSPIFAGIGGGQSTQSISVHNSSCTTPFNYRRANYIYKIKAEYNSSGTGTSEIICLTNNEKFTGTQTANIDATANYYIFSINTSQTHEGMSLYKLKLWKNNVLVRDFIPCYRNSDNVAGLYDLVNSTFYTNQGTGNFIVGSIKENESISLSDTNVNIPTIRGTNVLTVDTTVQPSNVYVKSRHESSYETAMRERYEEVQAQLDALESGGE